MFKRHRLAVKIFFLLTFTSISSFYSFAQLNQANLTQFTEKDGLPGSTVNHVLVDKFGFIWISTINGLARYDGYEFKRFFNNPNDSNSIKGLDCWKIFEDRKGRIWASAAPQNLNLYDQVTKKFRNYPFSHLIEHPANVELGIWSICEDSKGRIYFGVTTNYGDRISNGLLYFDENENEVKKVVLSDSLIFQNVISVTADREDNIWFISFNGIFKLDMKGKITPINALDSALKKRNEYPNNIKIDKEGHLWVITNISTLYDYNPIKGIFSYYSPALRFPSPFNGNNFAFDLNENIWLGTATGLKFFDKKNKRFDEFKQGELKQYVTAGISDIQIDSFGTAWIATSTDGLLKYEQKAQLTSHSYIKGDKNSIAPGWVNNIVETRDGNIWLTSSGRGPYSGLNALDSKGEIIYSLPYHLLKPGVLNLTGLGELTPGVLLLSTNIGILEFSTKSRTIQKSSINGLIDSALINYFYTDKKQNQWLCTTNGLYRKGKSENRFARYNLGKLDGANASSNEVTRVFESPKHGLWLLTNNGLFLYDYKTDSISRSGFDKKLGDIFVTQDINALYEDESGTVWVGTWQGGLSKYSVDERKIKSYTRNDGLPSMSIQGILGDEKNHVLWLSTFDGLCRFNIQTGQSNNYSIADGIQSQLFADGSNLKTSTGLFFFGGSNGITFFNPDYINKSSTPPRVLITDLKLFNKSVIPGQSSVLQNAIYDTKEITLAYNQNNISLDFIALHYANPAKNKYAFKMENYDNDWREVGNQHEAFYPKLPPGKYLFRVKAANNNSVWNEEGASLRITVMPPWWQTPWAYGAYALALLGMGFLLNRYMRQRLLAAETEKNQARELAQAKEIEKAYHKLEESHEILKATQSQLIQSEKMASLGELTAGIAHEIQNPLNFINNFSEINTELIEEMNEGIEKGNLDEVKSIGQNIRENESKINHHGKRADAIVKGMLQHSRVSTGLKESVDINALVDEYIRLSYHGLRAKDKSFNATLKSELDQSIGNIQIIPQDIGRVLLNLLNNAFFSVFEKSKQNIPEYEPTVTVTTKNMGAKVRISVEDNGMGIPPAIRDKIFQPFFTTKSSGQGTGLGLSLSYDIVKAHGGEIGVDSKPNEYTVFHIDLPV